jgi:uncharacterized membrane protein (DUF2068 family)
MFLSVVSLNYDQIHDQQQLQKAFCDAKNKLSFEVAVLTVYAVIWALVLNFDFDRKV